MPDILFILLLALVILGPRKLPEIAGQVGKYLAQFRRLKSELLDQINGEILLLEEERRIEQKPDTASQITAPTPIAKPEALSR
jgi:sec-independent protein translocase protein TatB